MSWLTRLLPPGRRALAADALLLTTATAAALLGLLTLVEEQVGDSGWYSWTSSLLILAVVLVCPWVAWRLHGGRTSGSSILGAAIGFLGGGFVLWVLLLLVGVVSLAVSWLSGDRVSEGLAAFVVVAAVLLAVLAALDTDAARDLARGRRHLGADVARIGATVVGVVTAAGAIWYAVANPGQQPAELLAFGLAAGVVGAVVALGADVASTNAPAAPPAVAG